MHPVYPFENFDFLQLHKYILTKPFLPILSPHMWIYFEYIRKGRRFFRAGASLRLVRADSWTTLTVLAGSWSRSSLQCEYFIRRRHYTTLYTSWQRSCTSGRLYWVSANIFLDFLSPWTSFPPHNNVRNPFQYAVECNAQKFGINDDSSLSGRKIYELEVGLQWGRHGEWGEKISKISFKN